MPHGCQRNQTFGHEAESFRLHAWQSGNAGSNSEPKQMLWRGFCMPASQPPRPARASVVRAWSKINAALGNEAQGDGVVGPKSIAEAFV
jgi:hypothetical protein